MNAETITLNVKYPLYDGIFPNYLRLLVELILCKHNNTQQQRLLTGNISCWGFIDLSFTCVTLLPLNGLF